MGCAGMRTATVSKPLVTRSGTRSDLGSTNVKGPGQNFTINASASFRMSFRVSSENDTTSFTCSKLWTCTINGSKAGRCLAWKIFSTAASL